MHRLIRILCVQSERRISLDITLESRDVTSCHSGFSLAQRTHFPLIHPAYDAFRRCSVMVESDETADCTQPAHRYHAATRTTYSSARFTYRTTEGAHHVQPDRTPS